jgi:hypothetical protein
VETVAEFVQRTQGPAVPFVPDWYPWVYAHHYLRLEAGQLPPDLGRGRTSLTATEARDIIQLWCALSGEGIESAAQNLADAYLRRWGLARSDGPDARPAQGAGRDGAGRDGAGRGWGIARRTRLIRQVRLRQVRRRAVRHGRARAVASLVPVGRRASAGS